MFRALIERCVAKAVEETIAEELDKRLPAIIERHLAKKFAAEPDIALTEVGFGWALGIALRKLWPDVPMAQAAKWLRDYLDVPFGDPGYVWTPRAAAELAHQYVADFAEGK